METTETILLLPYLQTKAINKSRSRLVFLPLASDLHPELDYLP